MESTNQRPDDPINMRGIHCYSNQVENFPIRMDADNFVLFEIKMNAGTQTQANRRWRRLQRNHNGVKSIVSPDSRPGDTIRGYSNVGVFLVDRPSLEL
jgi:hypothetical protein